MPINITLAEAALAAGMLLQNQSTLSPEDLICTARNVYFEARGESEDGQIAVAHVTKNRIESDKYPDSACSVVTQDLGPKAYDCQFSWWCDGKSDTPLDQDAYVDAMFIAMKVMDGSIEDNTDGALFYVATRSLDRKWLRRLTKTEQIGDHHFFRS